MRNKIALIVVLAGFLVVAALGASMAGADSPSLGTTGVNGLGEGAIAIPSLTAPACSNGTDDDGDGLVDMADPDCSSPQDNSEAPEPAAPSAPAPSTPSTPTAPEAGGGQAPGEAATEAPSEGGSGGGFKHGSAIGAGEGTEMRGGVRHNQSLGDSSGGSHSTGAVQAPSVTGGGSQPLPEGSNGGAPFSAGGAPTAANPTTTIAPIGPAPIGVPNFIIESFEIPPFLLPIYQACGTEYGVPWEVLAAINKIETGFGTNLNVSSAGAVGWMQFLPSSWETYGLDANGDGRKDPYNPVDAICAAAHYLKVAGAQHNLYKAIFSYNHADWYVQEVLLYARSYGRLPANLVGSLTGLTEGAHFPIAADARYADDLSARAALKRSNTRDRSYGNAAEVISSSPTRRGINIFSHAGAPVVAVNDGTIRKLGNSPKLGRFIVLEDTYGNRYTYAELGSIAQQGRTTVSPSGKETTLPVESQNLRPRLYALPQRARRGAKGAAGVDQASAAGKGPAASSTLRVGSRVIAGTLLGRVGASQEGIDPHINFSIQPAGSGAERIDPKPILDGWKLLEATAIYRAKGKNPFADQLSGAGVLLLSKEALQKRVLGDKGLDIYQCGREDIAAGRIDRRVLAMLEYLRSKGFRLRISALECGHGYLTSSGNVSEHSSGDAVDISEIDGVPVAGHQGPGTLTDKLIRDVLALQGTMHPHQVISLENLPGETSFALRDHYDHVHIGYYPEPEAGYVNPFPNATEGRTDQGVDFTGTGPIAAIGDAEILKTGAPGWPEGGGVLYRLLGGSHAGQVIFVYEGLVPTVKPGERVAAGQQIATFIPGGSIEIGFADANGVPLAHSVYTEGLVTEWGQKMAAFLKELNGSPLALDFSGLSASKWNRLITRLGEIPNPEVKAGPSKYAVPDNSAGTARIGSGSRQHGEY
ncbi:MAG TPA: lytic murein transglycosylase [Solirubrobacterales bacterium]